MAQIPYYLCALAALASSVRLLVGVVQRRQPRRAVVGVAASLVLAVAFALLTITAGPAPIVLRADALGAIRWLFAVGGGLWLLWVLLDMSRGVRIRRA
jgi:hypothetical protein